MQEKSTLVLSSKFAIQKVCQLRCFKIEQLGLGNCLAWNLIVI